MNLECAKELLSNVEKAEKRIDLPPVVRDRLPALRLQAEKNLAAQQALWDRPDNPAKK